MNIQHTQTYGTQGKQFLEEVCSIKFLHKNKQKNKKKLNLATHFKALEQKELITPKSIQQEILKLWAEISKIETTKIVSNEMKNY